MLEAGGLTTPGVWEKGGGGGGGTFPLRGGTLPVGGTFPEGGTPFDGVGGTFPEFTGGPEKKLLGKSGFVVGGLTTPGVWDEGGV
jgi:hypothetical protein